MKFGHLLPGFKLLERQTEIVGSDIIETFVTVDASVQRMLGRCLFCGAEVSALRVRMCEQTLAGATIDDLGLVL